ncbi:BH0509 family protein [Solibacillus sp. FSL H8-0538]|uniref:BH0509 family protein n=1 Tax=Solibacillus sp. FSL H8-0538 TaxID=2921400 RepID=UPI0030F8C6FD
MISEQERQNMVHFLVMYFGSDLNQLKNLSDSMLESTYEFAYTRTLMECDF